MTNLLNFSLKLTKRLKEKLKLIYKRKTEVKSNALYVKDSNQPYYSCKELGIEGRRKGTDIATRFAGLEVLCEKSICEGSTLLDLGCAEGLIAREFYKCGITGISGFDLQDISIQYAKKIFANFEGKFIFRQADLSDWNAFEMQNSDLLQFPYDIVLFLGIYHHLVNQSGEESANRTLQGALNLCKGFFAIRSSVEIPENLFVQSNFIELEESSISQNSQKIGRLRLFKKYSQ